MNRSIRHSPLSARKPNHGTSGFVSRHPVMLMTLVFMAALLAINLGSSSTSASKGRGAESLPRSEKQQGAKPVADVLNSDGSVRPGANGSFDMSGFRMEYGPNGVPRFVPAPPLPPADYQWDTPTITAAGPLTREPGAAADSGCFTDTTQADFQAGVPTNVDLVVSPGDVLLSNSGSYAASGSLVSSTKDANPSAGLTPIWSTLSWNGSTPANTSITFQVAGSNNVNGPFNFVGPDGTAGTFFTTSPAQLSTLLYNFRYVQYKALLSTTNSGVTPTLNDATLCFNNVDCSAPISITPTPAQVCANSTGNTASGPAGMTSYSWGITNGTITSATNTQSITYTAGASGNVELTLTVTEVSGCIRQGSANVTINADPTPPTITPTPAQVCANSTGNSAAGPAGASTYAWSIVNGTITSATNIQTITYTAGASGTVDLTLVVTNAAGCSASNTVNVTINANPSPPPITPTPAQVCASSTGNSAAGPAGATTYAWSIVNGTITSATNIQTITYTAGASGTVDLTLVVTNASGCSAGNTVNVTINANPATPPITPTPAQVCASSTGNSAAGPAGASTYAWSIVNGTITSATNIQTITYTAGASGTVDLTLVVTNASGCSASNTVNVTINPTPATPTITPGGPTTFCAGGSVTLTSSSASGNQWFLNGNPIGGATADTYNASASGNYTVTVTSGNGCTSAASAQTTVTVNPLPATPTITPGGPTTFCAGGSVTLQSSSASGNQWLLNGNPIGGATNQNYVATTSGNYTVVVTASGCSSAPSAATTVTVQPATITVANANDSGAGSLRQAIADACPSGATINFDTAGVFSTGQTITLTSGELAIGGNLTINGPATGLTISGNNVSRIFNVGSGKALLFSNLTIANGKASQGGGILNAGTLTIRNSTITNNHTANGANSSGPSVNGGNGGDGGGIYNTGTLKLINSTISGNQPGNGGDASGTDTSGNGGNGGGIFNSGGAFTSVNTTITNNKTGANGVNTTTTPSPGPFGNPGTGGGIYTSSGTVILRNTIVAGNFSVFQSLGPPRAFANSDDDINGAVDSSSANNFVGVDSGMTGISNGSNGNKVGSSGTPLSAGLNPLANNGGPTFTHLPQVGSLVLDAGNNTLAKDQNNSALTTDQRGTGFDRFLPTGGTVEIGAVEVDYGAPGSDADLRVLKSANVDQALPDTNITYTITVGNEGPGAATNATLTDALPPQVTFVSLSSPGGWLCTTPTVGTSGTVNCTNAGLPLTSGVVFTLVVHIVPGATQGSFITNQATVSTSAPDPNDENNSASASTLVTGSNADVRVTKVANSDASRADRDVVYTITVSNSGPTAAASVTLSDSLPSGMTFVSLTPPGGWSCGTPAVGSGGTVTCSNPSLAVTSGQVFTLVAHIPPGAPNGTFYFNQATISSSTSDPNPENNGSSAGTTVVACLTDPVVITNADSGAGSLRQAITDACDGSTITFDMNQVVSPITLTSAELLVNKNLTIHGPGANLLTIQRSTAVDTPSFRIFNITSGPVNISGLRISNGNSSAGGGILTKGPLSLTGCAITGNVSSNSGGGIKNDGANGSATLTLINCVVSGNTAPSFGGGILNTGFQGNATLNIINSTISGNTAPSFGGGIYNDGNSGTATLNLKDSTVSGNSASSSGGGIYNFGNGGIANLALANSIISDNTALNAANGPDIFNFSGSVTGSFNIIETNTGYTIGGSNNLSVDPMLERDGMGALALKNNGGPTPTIMLLTGSPAINAGSNANLPADSFDLDADSNTAEPLPVDQRGVGFARVFDSTVDIGAVETHYGITATAGTPQNTTISSAFGAVFQATVTESGNVKSGVPVTFTAPGSGASGRFPGNSLTATVNTDAGGVATAPTFTANGSAGTYNVVASLGAGLPTALFALTNNQAATTTAVSSSVNPSSLNQSVTFTATVTSLGGTPTGTVQFKDGGANLGSPQFLNGSGVATFSTSSLSAGAHTITADYSGDLNFLSSSGALATAQLVGSVIRFSADNYGTTEGAGHATITVERIGDLSAAVTIDYSTPDDGAAMTVLPCSTANGVASPRCDFETALGTLRWGPGDGSARTFTVLINQDVFVEGPETLTLTLSNPTGGAGLVTPGATSVAATLTIADDLTEPATNPIDDTETFVRQQYRDFLNREPDAAGLAFWKDNIDKCNDDNRRPAGLTVAQCIERYRVHTSAAFFLSVEFQNTGYFVERLYKAGYADISPPTVPVPVRFTNFLRDTQEVGAGVIVGQGSWETQLDNNKSAFALSFVQRPEFLSRYPNATSATSFVDSLNANAGGVLTDSERSALIAELTPNPADPSLRASVLRKIGDNALLQQQEFNRAFVLIEYFGYLRRNPDAAPEPNLNFDGYNFWLTKMDHLSDDFSAVEMVKSFIKSAEYRNRFGP